MDYDLAQPGFRLHPYDPGRRAQSDLSVFAIGADGEVERLALIARDSGQPFTTCVARKIAELVLQAKRDQTPKQDTYKPVPQSDGDEPGFDPDTDNYRA